MRLEFLGDDPAITLWHDGVFLPARVWQRQLWYAEDAREGIQTGEDALVAGYVEATLEPGGSLDLVASAEDDPLRALAREDRLGVPPPRTLAGCADAIEREERERIARWRGSALAGARVTARQAREAHAPKSPTPRACSSGTSGWRSTHRTRRRGRAATSAWRGSPRHSSSGSRGAADG